jgi:hypothetical protein
VWAQVLPKLLRPKIIHPPGKIRGWLGIKARLGTDPVVAEDPRGRLVIILRKSARELVGKYWKTTFPWQRIRDVPARCGYSEARAGAGRRLSLN